MDSFTTQKPKSRKMKKIAKKSRVQTILDLIFRAIEIIVVSVTVAKLCYQLVITFEDSGVAAVIFANRNLAFVLGNTIIIALIAKSGLLLNQDLDQKCKSNDLYEEFIRESSRRDEISRAKMRNREKQSGEEKNETKQSITETRDKQNAAEKETQSTTENIAKQIISAQAGRHTVIEKKTKQKTSEKREKQSKPEKFRKQSNSVKREKQSNSVKREKQSIVDHQEVTVKKMEKQNLAEKREIQSYQRSRSENLEGLEKISLGRLRRSETDASFERFDSDDELRYKIESFIARQSRNQNDD
ncbi:hypothetical protein EUTSA_v10025841mg [Eutrema salsugineum]|uniref:Uncharacterized protein n=1 Tax=Eutrema salsugineum TaxID=72664 RepID=V4MA04_EUTSA|nr:uncharacterized protein DDB_G0279979 [Eutrema salsugineum]ESQ53174.1 hypothetical protein EUTSA_v10025841mg [Eutrema salsugineum]